jgi:hypothetical protein
VPLHGARLGERGLGCVLLGILDKAEDKAEGLLSMAGDSIAWLLVELELRFGSPETVSVVS